MAVHVQLDPNGVDKGCDAREGVVDYDSLLRYGIGVAEKSDWCQKYKERHEVPNRKVNRPVN
jgi:hypothetical protein